MDPPRSRVRVSVSAAKNDIEIEARLVPRATVAAPRGTVAVAAPRGTVVPPRGTVVAGLMSATCPDLGALKAIADKSARPPPLTAEQRLAAKQERQRSIEAEIERKSQRAQQRFEQIANHKVRLLVEKAVSAEELAEQAELRQVQSEKRLGEFKKKQRAELDQRAADARVKLGRVRDQVQRVRVQQEEKAQEMSLKAEEKMEHAGAVRQRELEKWQQKGLERARSEQLFRGSAEGRFERDQQKLVAQGMRASAHLEAKAQKVAEIQEGIKQALEERAAEQQESFAKKRQLVADHQQMEKQEREDKHLAFESKFLEKRDKQRSNVVMKQEKTRDLTQRRRQRFERGHQQVQEERTERHEAIVARHERAAHNAQAVKALGLKAGVSMEDHCAVQQARHDRWAANSGKLERLDRRRVRNALEDARDRDKEAAMVEKNKRKLEADRQALTRSLLLTQTHFQTVFKKIANNKGGAAALKEAAAKMGFGEPPPPAED